MLASTLQTVLAVDDQLRRQGEQLRALAAALATRVAEAEAHPPVR
jgi:hypothetical protein